MRDRTLPTVSPRRTTSLLLASSAVLLVSLIAASLTRISVPSRSLPHLGAAPNAIVRPLVLLPVGTTDDPETGRPHDRTRSRRCPIGSDSGPPRDR
jgi:hypothetical protein